MALKVKDIVKLQLFGLEQLDFETLKKLKPALLAAEQELTNDLNRWSSEQFSHKTRRQNLALISRSLDRIEQITNQEFYNQAQEMNEFGVDLAEEEVRGFNKNEGITTPNLKRDLLSLEANDYLINNFQSSLRSYNQETRANVSNAISQGMLQKRTGYEISTKLGNYIKVKDWKIQRIVRTELSRVFNASKLLSYGQFKEKNFPDLMKRMFHPKDNRTADDSKQWKKADPAIPLDKPFRLVIRRKRADGTVKKEVQQGMTPPLRPNDRAVLLSWRPQWEEE